MSAWRGVVAVGLLLPSGCQSIRDSVVAAGQVLGSVLSIGWVASAYQCSCQRWPASWEELAAFGDGMQARSVAEGAPAPWRIPWSRLSSSSVSATEEGGIQITLVGLGADAEPASFRIGPAECSTFPRERVADLCPSPRSSELGP